ncbi:RecQ family ATP-dependent DNA helicase [Neolewinella antarctica]|uniref:ATP-dependent DNA helicase RecQ n=1 Tax=Neolewinella antarctica TaxID=442734 RepID=A0ABX0X6J8_9BACT|nr:ATP-dependent DNA helicase RecQ [Neolewinella antarctica]NJC24841.1 ATP-dependent DNA helicase RecQ [Neolewinella antarctica]
MTPTEVLQKYWGYPAFRPGQEEIIDAVMAGRDTLALLPTGGGKSVCFQVPAVALPGVTIVVCPLIALMKDQVRQLKARGIIAEAIYSGLRHQDIDRILDNAVYGKTKLLYLSPERLRTELAQVRIAKMNVSLIAVDEAHCISQWGYDFRPPYLRIAEIREALPRVPVIAVTATATPEVVLDIQENLKFRPNALIVQQSFGRDNLAYVVRRPGGKERQMLKVLEGVPGSSIVYVRSRGLTKKLALLLRRNGINAASYHAGLEPKEKDERQDAWIRGDLRVIVATNAFGMGIDKPNVRSVIHYGPPDSPEAYFQEAGRGGRDGKMSYGIMLYGDGDGERLRQHWRDSFPDLAEIRRVYRALGSYLQIATGVGEGVAYDFDVVEFSNRFEFDVRPALAGLKALERAGYILLTDAVHQPAKIRFLVTKERLYDYQIKNRHTEKLIKTILRTTHGSFLEPVRIDEGALANFLKVPIQQLQRTLVTMATGEVVEYFPQKDDPQVIFLENRVKPEHLHIDQQAYKFLKDRHEIRIETMIAYCSKDLTCRSVLFLQYFGEADAVPCGICDVCRSQTTSTASITPRALYTMIQQKLTEGSNLKVEEVITAYGNVHRPTTTEALERLLREGLVIRQGDQLKRP